MSLGDGSVVLSPEAVGDRFIDEVAFVTRYPGLRLAFEVETPRPLRLHEHVPTPRRSFWWSVARFLTLGLVGAGDCVEVVAGHLRLAGLDIPAWVVTPHSLLVRLLRYGGRCVSIGP